MTPADVLIDVVEIGILFFGIRGIDGFIQNLRQSSPARAQRTRNPNLEEYRWLIRQVGVTRPHAIVIVLRRMYYHWRIKKSRQNC